MKSERLELRKKYGADFVYKSIKLLIDDNDYLSTVRAKVKPEYFAVDDTATSKVVERILENYDEKHSFTLDDLKYDSKGDANGDDAALRAYGYAFGKIMEQDNTNSEEALKERLTPYLTLCHIEEIAEDLKTRVTYKTYEKNPTPLLQRALVSVTQELNTSIDDYGTSLEDDIDSVFEPQNEQIIKVGEPKIDNLINGGARIGSLAGFVAPTGAGKSTLSSLIGFEAAKQGRNVVHIFFEDQKAQIWKKYCARMTGTPINDQEGDIAKENVKGNPFYKALTNHLKLCRWENGVKTVEDIESYLLQADFNEWKPDMLIIDYFDCLKLSRNPTKDALEAEASTMRKLENLANRMNILIWVMFQANRLSTSNSNSDGSAQNIQGSKKKIDPLSLLLGVGNDKEYKGYSCVEISKIRFGGKLSTIHKVIFNRSTVSFDWSQSEIDYVFSQDEDKENDEDWLTTLDALNMAEPQITVNPAPIEPFRLTTDND